MNLNPFAKILLTLVCLLGFSSMAQADEESVTLAGRSVVYWKPANAEKGTHPLILFSHGLHGNATQSRFLTEALAADGYWVFAPNHQDAVQDRKTMAFQRPEESFIHPQDWSEKTYENRAEDIREVLNSLRKDKRFKNRIDFTRIGLMGHSLGGYTVLGLAGGWSSWKLPGIRAVLALSPYSNPFNVQRTLQNITIPIMLQGGTRDFGITPFVRQPGGSYDQLASSKYYVEFEGAGHFAWTNIGNDAQKLMTEYSEAFFDHYIKKESASKTLTSALPGVSQFKYSSELGSEEKKQLPAVQAAPARQSPSAFRAKLQQGLRARIQGHL